MGWLDRFTARPETKESQVSSVLVMGTGGPVWTPRNYASFATEGYGQNNVVYQAVNRVAEAVSSVKWTVWRGDAELVDHPLLSIMERPNPFQSGSQFMQEKVGYLMISGQSYDEKIEVNGTIRELYTHRPDRMKVNVTSDGAVGGYTYEVNGRKTVWDGPDGITGIGDIRHLKLFNPLHDWYGQAPMESAAYAVDQHNEAMRWLQALLQNSARPSGALVSEGTLGDDEFNRLKAQMEEQYQGSKNGGRPMLLEGDMKWIEMGLGPNDMGITEIKNSAARDIALAFGVPPQLLGIPGDNTYSNYKEARLAFWEDTVLPLVHLIAQDWTAWIGNGLEIKPDLDEIPAIVDKRMTLWEMADASDDLTINETRELKGFEPLEDSDPRGKMLKGELNRAQSSQGDVEQILGKMAYGA